MRPLHVVSVPPRTHIFIHDGASPWHIDFFPRSSDRRRSLRPICACVVPCRSDTRCVSADTNCQHPAARAESCWCRPVASPLAASSAATCPTTTSLFHPYVGQVDAVPWRQCGHVHWPNRFAADRG